jgi:uncharacterized SAM-binding protein YcdF (DUF218 family)
MRHWRKIAAGLLVAPFVWILFLAASIVWYSGESDAGPADAAVVLGAAVANGAPTPVFKERIQHAINLYKARKVRVLVLTGGVGAGDTLAESEVARAYCLARGVAPQDIAIETRSRSTYENLVQARRVLDARGLKRSLIVSDPLHMRRAVTEARDVGIDAHPSPTPTSRYTGLASRSQFTAREVYFYAQYLLFRTFADADAIQLQG